MSATDFFLERTSIEQVEESTGLAPKFDDNGLIPVVTTDFVSGEVLMHAYMNREALSKTLELGEPFTIPAVARPCGIRDRPVVLVRSSRKSG